MTGPRAAIAYLGLGSNVGDRAGHLRHAVGRLGAAGRVTGLSSVYETEPAGFADQSPFLNLVVRVATSLSPPALLSLVRDVEAERGRERPFPNAPRTLDIDLLLYGDRRIRTSDLEVPHPRMAFRPFVLVPLLELAPEARDPVTGDRYADRLSTLTAGGQAQGVEKVASAAELMEEPGG